MLIHTTLSVIDVLKNYKIGHCTYLDTKTGLREKQGEKKAPRILSSSFHLHMPLIF